ncbi:hypothetical protein H2198_007906 [Neophaeococcomyces mojaviensis]|uniref:Uncharacterized protein n=1 Tax=Neophaeococcomyces mojaviensis TaxID=3383035 RepID=A0ACC2ZYM4_9EURO|nr:hypothetical protein H2198_007906 [Knufia sp. JES_112]
MDSARRLARSWRERKPNAKADLTRARARFSDNPVSETYVYNNNQEAYMQSGYEISETGSFRPLTEMQEQFSRAGLYGDLPHASFHHLNTQSSATPTTVSHASFLGYTEERFQNDLESLMRPGQQTARNSISSDSSSSYVSCEDELSPDWLPPQPPSQVSSVSSSSAPLTSLTEDLDNEDHEQNMNFIDIFDPSTFSSNQPFTSLNMVSYDSYLEHRPSKAEIQDHRLKAINQYYERNNLPLPNSTSFRSSKAKPKGKAKQEGQQRLLIPSRDSIRDQRRELDENRIAARSRFRSAWGVSRQQDSSSPPFSQGVLQVMSPEDRDLIEAGQWRGVVVPEDEHSPYWNPAVDMTEFEISNALEYGEGNDFRTFIIEEQPPTLPPRHYATGGISYSGDTDEYAGDIQRESEAAYNGLTEYINDQLALSGPAISFTEPEYDNDVSHQHPYTSEYEHQGLHETNQIHDENLYPPDDSLSPTSFPHQHDEILPHQVSDQYSPEYPDEQPIDDHEATWPIRREPSPQPFRKVLYRVKGWFNGNRQKTELEEWDEEQAAYWWEQYQLPADQRDQIWDGEARQWVENPDAWRRREEMLEEAEEGEGEEVGGVDMEG